MRRLLIGAYSAAIVVSLAACGGSSGELGRRADAAAEGGLLGDRPDREELPRGDDEEGHRPDDEPVGAERDLHRRSRGDRRREGARSGSSGSRVGRVQARRTTGSRTTPAYKLRDHGQRRPGHAALRVPLRRRRDGKVAVGHGRRPGRRADRRTVADHQHGGGIDHAGPLSPCRTPGSEAAKAAVDEQRRPLSRGDDPLVRAVGRLPAKVHTKLLIAFVGTARAARRRRPARAARPRAVERPRREPRGAPGASLRVRQAPERRRARSSAPRGERRPGLLQGLAGGDPDRIGTAASPSTRRVANAARADRAGDRSPTGSGSCLRPRTRAHPSQDPADEPAGSRRDGARSSTRQAPPRGASGASRTGRAARRRPQPARHGARQRHDGEDQRPDRPRTRARTRARGTCSSASRRGRSSSRCVLGFVLSWSLIGPIQRIDARLAAIASGDFSGHVDVANRDELGALAANVNRMNDELRRLYAELEAASRHKSEFLANMSHELRTPLNAIIGFSQVLRERMFGEMNEKQEEYLDDILSSGNHLLSLINDVLDLSKVEAGQVELEVAPFSLREALERGVVDGARAGDDGRRQRRARGGSGRRHRRGRRAPDQAGDLQPALERGEVHACGRGRRRERGAGQRRGAGLGRRHRPGHRPRGPRADLRGVPADRGRASSSARGPASGSRSRSGSSSSTAAGSGSRASSAREARSSFTLPAGSS